VIGRKVVSKTIWGICSNYPMAIRPRKIRVYCCFQRKIKDFVAI